MKNIIKIFICFSLIYTPFSVFAGAAEKWEILKNDYEPEKRVVKIEAKKIAQQASNSGVYKVQIPVSTTRLGATVKSMMWTGIAVAGVQAMLEGIGWIIDTGSKTIYREKLDDDETLPNTSIVYSLFDASQTINGGIYQYRYYASPQVACNSTDMKILYPQWVVFIDKGIVYNGSKCLVPALDTGPRVSSYPNPNFKPDVNTPEREYLSDNDLGNEIIGNGENKAPLPSAITNAYDPNNPVGADSPAPKDSNDALENATPEPEDDITSETEKEKDENGNETGKEITKWPLACEWFPAACEFFKLQKQDNIEIKENQKEDIAQNKSFFDKASDWFDWSKQNDDLPPDEKPEIKDLPIPDLKEDAIRWSAQCPADVQVPINLQGVSSTITFSWSPWCQLLDMIKPAIIASAYIGAAFIVLGLRT